MSEKKYNTIHQHEPLRTPTGWNFQEKSFVAQLEEVLDDIYRRFGRLKMNDLGTALKAMVQESADGVAENRTAIEQTEKSIALKASQAAVDALGRRVESAEAELSVVAGKIELKASQESLDTLTGRVSSAEASLAVAAGRITLKADKTTVDAIGNTVAEHSTQIAQNAEAIVLKASQASVDALGKRVGNVETSVTQTAKDITLKADKTTVSELSTRVSSAQSVAVAAQSAAGAAQSAANTNATNISRLTTRVEEAELKISPEVIVSTVRTSTEYTSDLEGKASTGAVKKAQDTAYAASKNASDAAGMASSALSKANTAQNTADTAQDSANTAQNAANTAQNTADTNAADISTLGTRVASAETSIQQNAQSITLKANQTTIDNILNGTTGVPKVSNSTLTIDANGIRMSSGSISLSAEASLLLTSGGSVDINGAKGSIDLGEGSQVSASTGTFAVLSVGGVPYMPIVLANTEPLWASNCFWAKPVSGGSAQATMATPGSRTLALGGFTGSYGTSSNPHVYTMGASREVLTGSYFDYTFTIPFYRVDSGSTTKSMYVTISRGSSSITFPMATLNISQYYTTTLTFVLSSSTVNLFAAGLVSSSFSVKVWSSPSTNYTVYVQSNSTATLTAKVNGASGGTQQCVLYYIPQSYG